MHGWFIADDMRDLCGLLFGLTGILELLFRAFLVARTEMLLK